MNAQLSLFYLFSFIALASGVGVITFRDTIHSAMSLLLTFFSVAVLYVLLESEFLAAVQLYIYAGAIMVLLVFVVMLVNVKEAKESPSQVPLVVVSIFIGLGLFLFFLFVIFTSNFTQEKGIYDEAYQLANGGQTKVLGIALYSEYLFPFEVASLLLLVAMLGAIILPTRRRFRRGGQGEAI